MTRGRPGWRAVLRHGGGQYLEWLAAQEMLERKFDVLATALSTLLTGSITDPASASNVWSAAPAVLSRCNEQDTYRLPGAVLAYAWLHLLDRYARTWRALEVLVNARCLPMARSGVRALDIGTGPGPSAFAVHDFYAAMEDFAVHTANDSWRQPAALTCVEFDAKTNSFRHHLAEMIFEMTQRKPSGALAMCGALPDFGALVPTEERVVLERQLRYAEERYFDEVSGDWDYSPIHSAEEANVVAQSHHRYRLVVFSNFLTTVGVVRSFEKNLADLLHDARPGCVLLVIGGKGGPYIEVYEYIEHLAAKSGFRLEVEREEVSSAQTKVAERVYAEGAKMCSYLLGLSPNENSETALIRGHFADARQKAPSSQIWAYRKYGHGTRTT